MTLTKRAINILDREFFKIIPRRLGDIVRYTRLKEALTKRLSREKLYCEIRNKRYSMYNNFFEYKKRG